MGRAKITVRDKRKELKGQERQILKNEANESSGEIMEYRCIKIVVISKKQ